MAKSGVIRRYVAALVLSVLATAIALFTPLTPTPNGGTFLSGALVLIAAHLVTNRTN